LDYHEKDKRLGGSYDIAKDKKTGDFYLKAKKIIKGLQEQLKIDW